MVAGEDPRRIYRMEFGLGTGSRSQRAINGGDTAVLDYLPRRPIVNLPISMLRSGFRVQAGLRREGLVQTSRALHGRAFQPNQARPPAQLVDYQEHASS